MSTLRDIMKMKSLPPVAIFAQFTQALRKDHRNDCYRKNRAFAAVTMTTMHAHDLCDPTMHGAIMATVRFKSDPKDRSQARKEEA